MEEALRFFRAFEVWIYLLLGLGGLIYLRKFIVAWQELRGASFGLERENAQARLNQAATVLVLLLSMAVTVFVLVSFIAPEVPGASPLPTPTLNLLATPTGTLPPTTQEAGGGVEQPTATPGPVAGATEQGCLEGQIEISSPQAGQEVSGVVEITGTVDIPNFGFYMFEMKHPDETKWLTIQAGDIPHQAEKLGDWDTRRLSPGEYQLGLVVVDNQGKSYSPCVINLRVAQSSDETPGP
jgi:hypothetical protein